MSADDIGVMRELFANGASQAEIALRFGADRSHVSRVVRNEARLSGVAEGGQ